MPLIDEISAAIADAMRKHDQGRLSALRMLKAALMNREVEKKRSLDDSESCEVAARFGRTAMRRRSPCSKPICQPQSIPLCWNARFSRRFPKPARPHPK